MGGGIAGLAAAIALQQRGVRAIVLEQAPEIGEIGAGLLMAPNACKVLDRLGALESLQAGRCMPVSRWELRDWKGGLLSAMKIPRLGESSLSTRRSDLQWALLQRLAPGTLQTGRQVRAARLDDDGVILTFEDGREMTARRVIVADGANSQVRASLWNGREPRYCGYVGWRGLVDHVPAGWGNARVCESWGSGRRFGIAPVGDGRTYWYASATIPEARCCERVGLAQLKRDFSGWHDPVTELLEAMDEAALLQHPISDRRPAWSSQIDEKIVLIGDAAHPLTPNLGQGASMALEDAWELAVRWHLPGAMARFESSRRFRVMRLWAISRGIGKMIQWRHPALCGLRAMHLRGTPNGLSTAMMRRLLNYVPGEEVG